MANLPTIKDDLGNIRPLGFIPGDPARMMAVPPMAASDIIPESEWVEFDIDTSAVVKVKDQNGYGACFPAGTRVRMEDGSEREIQGVRLRDRVLTAEGNVGRVIRTMVRDADDGLIRISLWGHNHLRATAEHPILTERGYVPAGSLVAGDWVAMPCYAPASRKHILTADHVARRAVPVWTQGGYNQAHEDRYLSVLPDAIEMTATTGRLFGLFMAEGHVSKNRLVWTFSGSERDTLVAEVVRLLKSEWDLDAVIVERKQDAIDIRVNSGAWARLFESLCATGSAFKRMHPDLASGPREFLGSMLEGWLDGDGHDRRNERQGVTISRDLALGMFDIAQALGLRPSIRRYQSKTYGTVKTRQARWEVSLGQGGKDTYRCKADASHVWRKVKGVEREEFAGPVFNLEVEGDNSYVAEGIGVHNCNGHAAATSGEASRYVSGMPPVDLSAWYVYAILCNGVDRGSMILDALELMSSDGCAPESLVKYGIINPRSLTSQAHTAAPNYKIEIGSRITNYLELGTAVQRQESINLAVCVGNSFNNLNSDGVPGLGRGYCNHAVHVGMGMKRAKDGSWLVKMQNSWTTQWGENGFCWLPAKYVPTASAFEGYTIRAMFEDTADNTKPPVIIA